MLNAQKDEVLNLIKRSSTQLTKQFHGNPDENLYPINHAVMFCGGSFIETIVTNDKSTTKAMLQCIQICMHAHTHSRKCMHRHTHAHPDVCIHTGMHTCIHPDMHTCIHPDMHT